MDQKKPEKKLTALQEKVRAANKLHPVGTMVKYTDKEKVTHNLMVMGSAREEGKKIVIQVKGIDELVSIESVQPVS